MPHWVPTWQLAVTVAGCLAAVSVAVRVWVRLDRAHGGPARPKTGYAALAGWEVAIIIAIYGFWQYAGSLALVSDNHGQTRGQDLWKIERDFKIPSEQTFQSWFLPHPWLVKFLNIYYVIAHYNVLLIMLAWLFWRHRDKYREARTVIGLTTFVCLAVQLIPFAPPRLISGHGGVNIVDTALRYGQSVYGPQGQGFSDQYSAMPSVHIAWSAAVGFFVWRSTRSRWRWLGIAHALLTWVVVVATGNHYWLDGFVAILLLALSFWTVRLITYAWHRVSEWALWTPAGQRVRAGWAVYLPERPQSCSPDAVGAAALPGPSPGPAPPQAQPPPLAPASHEAAASPPSR